MCESLRCVVDDKFTTIPKRNKNYGPNHLILFHKFFGWSIGRCLLRSGNLPSSNCFGRKLALAQRHLEQRHLAQRQSVILCQSKSGYVTDSFTTWGGTTRKTLVMVEDSRFGNRFNLFCLFSLNGQDSNFIKKWANPGLFLFIFVIFSIQFE